MSTEESRRRNREYMRERRLDPAFAEAGRQASLAWHYANPEKARLRKQRYTKAHLAPIGTCPICLRPNLKLYNDHCHKLNLKREFICHNCNTVLGHAKDDPEILRRAALYLERYNGLFAERELAQRLDGNMAISGES